LEERRTRQPEAAAVPQSEGAPDYVEPFVGWRLWLVVADGGYLWLESVLYPSRWMPLRPFHAICIPHRRCVLCGPAARDVEPEHAAPDESCHCGVYAVADPSSLASYLDGAHPSGQALDRVIGRVRLWGTVIECERGWRAALAYPEQIYVPARGDGGTRRQVAHIVAGLRDYGIPVEPMVWRTTADVIAATRAA
jgi:hypothetical protein